MDDDLQAMFDDGSEEDDYMSSILPTASGRIVSEKGLIERIIDQFNDEFTPQFLAAVESDLMKRQLVKDVSEYIFAVEGVELSLAQQANIMKTVYSEAVTYSGLDVFFGDERVTTISIEGAKQLSVRYEPGSELIPQLAIFEDHRHAKRILERLISVADTEFQDLPIMEVGMKIGTRRICLNIAVPPYVTEIRADIRVHPTTLPTLDDLVVGGFMNEVAKEFLLRLVKSEHGFVIVGDTESGKSTLMSVLAQHLPNPQTVMSVERGGELQLPEGATAQKVQWGKKGKEGITFEQLVNMTLEKNPSCMLLDEVRADENRTITPLLVNDVVPRQIWSVRGASDAMKIRSALGMLARLSYPAQPEWAVTRMYQRLPFIVIVKRRKGYLQLNEIAEWQYFEGMEYPEYVPLLQRGADGLERTDKASKLLS
jgi:type IV secretory pathway ATPase VirB11/archaellum biosynthesis ATPase